MRREIQHLVETDKSNSDAQPYEETGRDDPLGLSDESDSDDDSADSDDIQRSTHHQSEVGANGKLGQMH